MSIQVTYHGHSCFTLSANGYQIVLDPYDGHVPGYAPLKLCANEVLCSHEHLDHCYPQAVELVSGGNSPFTVTELQIPHDDAYGTLRGMTYIRVFECDGIRVAHFGDIGCTLGEKELAFVQNLDAALIPVGGVYTLNAQQSNALANKIAPRVVIPMHYRLGALGFEVIGTLDEFTALRTDVVSYESNTLTIDAALPRQTAVLQYKG